MQSPPFLEGRYVVRRRRGIQLALLLPFPRRERGFWVETGEAGKGGGKQSKGWPGRVRGFVRERSKGWWQGGSRSVGSSRKGGLGVFATERSKGWW